VKQCFSITVVAVCPVFSISAEFDLSADLTAVEAPLHFGLMGTQESQEALPHGVWSIRPPRKHDFDCAPAIAQRSESDIPRLKVLHGFRHDRYAFARLDHGQDRLPETRGIDDIWRKPGSFAQAKNRVR